MGQLDWILHGHQLAEDRLRAWNEERDGDPAPLRREVALRRRVWDCLVRGDDPEQLPGRAREMYWCMWHHAEAQVMRYAREISEEEFRARCGEIRAYRKKVVG